MLTFIMKYKWAMGGISASVLFFATFSCCCTGYLLVYQVGAAQQKVMKDNAKKAIEQKEGVEIKSLDLVKINGGLYKGTATATTGQQFFVTIETDGTQQLTHWERQ